MKFIVLLFCLIPLGISAALHPLLTEADKKIYYIEDQPFKELSFQLRVKGLRQQLEESKIFGKLSDVYFDITWRKDAKPTIALQGLPNGFEQKKNQLQNFILPVLNLIFFRKLSDNYQKFEFKSLDKTTIEGYHYDPLKGGIQTKIMMNNTGVPAQFISKFPNQTEQKVETQYKKSQKRDQLLLTSMTQKRQGGNGTLVIQSSLKYDKINMLEVPTKIQVKTWFVPNLKNYQVKDENIDTDHYTLSQIKVMK